MVHLYCGDGKGKTTAAFGLALRAAGAGLKVVVCRFMKNNAGAECSALEKTENVRFVICPLENVKFFNAMTDADKTEYHQIAGAMFAKAKLLSHGCDMLVFDEACSAVTTGMLDLQALLEFITPFAGAFGDGAKEIVLTGRDPAPQLTEIADYITEMRCVKHPYDCGVKARKGIEY